MRLHVSTLDAFAHKVVADRRDHYIKVWKELDKWGSLCSNPKRWRRSDIIPPSLFLVRPLDGDTLFVAVDATSLSAGGSDGWGWNAFRAFSVGWFDGLAAIFVHVEETGVRLGLFTCLVPTLSRSPKMVETPLTLGKDFWVSSNCIQVVDYGLS